MRPQTKFYLISILWPSFMMAIVLTGIFFSTFDPVEIAYYMGVTDISHLGAYTIGFFLFWLAGAMNGLLAIYFSESSPRNRY